MTTKKPPASAAELRERMTLLRLRQDIKLLRAELREERQRRQAAEARLAELQRQRAAAVQGAPQAQPRPAVQGAAAPRTV